MINDRIFLRRVRKSIKKWVKMVCAPQKLFTGKESLTAGFYEIYLNRLKKKKGMVAVNWIIKSSERCEHHKGLVDGRLSQESDNTYRERTVVKHWGS